MRAKADPLQALCDHTHMAAPDPNLKLRTSNRFDFTRSKEYAFL